MRIALVAVVIAATTAFVGGARPDAVGALGIEPDAVATTGSSEPPTVDPDVDAALAAEPTSPFWVFLRDQADLAPARKITDWGDRGRAVVDELRAVADRSQPAVRGLIAQLGGSSEPFWIVNALKVTGGNALLDALRLDGRIASIRPDRDYELSQLSSTTSTGPTADSASARTGVAWNIDRVRAPGAWTLPGGRGDGVVVGAIDSGAEHDHPALAATYRGATLSGSSDHSASWFDGWAECPGPCDSSGHGTHVLGTMVGDDGTRQIGVAPAARWIAARACNHLCPADHLVAAGQWMLGPAPDGADPRPTLRPHVINNSWGGHPGDPFYEGIVEAWVASGIFPVFAAGNRGPDCKTVGSPADYDSAYAVSAFDSSSQIASFSSRGSGGVNATKPNIAAPGVDVISSIPGRSYAAYSGTSMAAPHVAGAVAAMLGAAPGAIGDVDAIRVALDSTAVDAADSSCGGSPSNNAVWGEGTLDVRAAVDELRATTRGAIVTGSVKNADGAPVADALIEFDGPMRRSGRSNASGIYQVALLPGDYKAAAQAFGYATAQAMVSVENGTTTTQTFTLAPVDRRTITGTLTRRDTAGSIGGATVTLSRYLPPVVADSDGRFVQPDVPDGTYRVLVDALCVAPEAGSIVVSATKTSFAITVEPQDDKWGYRCRTSRGSMAPTTETLPLTGDDAAHVKSLPFPFTFYGTSYSSVLVSTNGYVSFDPETLDKWNSGSIPASASPNAAVYGFWDNLIIDAEASVRSAVIGSAPSRVFVIEWNNARFYEDFGSRMTVQVLLHEDGLVTTTYGTVDSTFERGATATVGLEDPAGTRALQVVRARQSITSGLSLVYSLGTRIVVTAGGAQSATVDEPYAGPLEARVIDGDGLPVSGVPVTFSAPTGGASGVLGDGSSTHVVSTTSLGRASTTATANRASGRFSVLARAPGVIGTAEFVLTNLAGPATTLDVVRGDDQHAVIDHRYLVPPTVRALDAYGNPANESIRFRSPAVGPSGKFDNGTNERWWATTPAGTAWSEIVANASTGSFIVTAEVVGRAVPLVQFDLTNHGTGPAVTVGKDRAVTSFGETLTLSASTSRPDPPGFFSFFAGTTLLGTRRAGSDGIARLAVNKLEVGGYELRARYDGDPNTPWAFSQAMSHTVERATPPLSVTLAPEGTSAFKQWVLVETIIRISTRVDRVDGTVTLFDRGVAVKTVDTGGSDYVRFWWDPPKGSHQVHIEYSGDSNLTHATSAPLAHHVAGTFTRTNLWVDYGTAAYGSEMSLIIDVDPMDDRGPVGTARIWHGDEVIATTRISERRTFHRLVNPVEPGQRILRAEFVPEDPEDFSGSFADRAMTSTKGVPAVALAISPARTAPAGAPVELTARVAGEPTVFRPGGIVEWFADGTSLGTTILDEAGVATLVTSSLPPGSHELTARYGGDARYLAGVSPAVDYTIGAETPTRRLSVVRGGTGSGEVTSAPAGVACGSDCSESFPQGSHVELTAVPHQGYVFTGWGEACRGAGTASTCALTMDTSKDVAATFEPAPPRRLNVTRAGSGTGSVTSSPGGVDCGTDCSETFAHGTPVTLTATPSPGQHFTGWSGGCTGLQTCSIVMSADVDVTATFGTTEPAARGLALAIQGSGRVVSSPNGIDCETECSASFPHNTVVTLTAMAAPGHVFDRWTGACVGTGACSVTMDAAKSVVATFTFPRRVLSVSSAVGGTVSGSGISCPGDCNELFDHGSLTAVTASPATNYVFTRWFGDTCAGTASACQVQMDRDRSVAAQFDPTPRDLTVVRQGVGDGFVSSMPSGISCGSSCTKAFGHGSSVTLTATPWDGSFFVGWDGGVCASTTATTCTVTLDAAKSVIAVFGLVDRTLTVQRAGGGVGRVSSSPSGVECPSACVATFSHGTTVTLTARPADGSVHAGWTGVCSGVRGPTCAFPLTGNWSVTAVFERLPAHLVVTRGGAGTGAVNSSPGGIDCGDDCEERVDTGLAVTLTAVASTGSRFAGWTGACSGSWITCSITMDADKLVTAVFEPVPRYLEVGKRGSGLGTVASSPGGIHCGSDCTEGFDHGKLVTLTAFPSSGHAFGGWSGACSGTSTTCTLTMDVNRAVTATFDALDSAPPPTSPTAMATMPSDESPPPGRSGYWMVGADGVVYGFGDAHADGNAPVGVETAEDLEPTPSGSGYWIVDGRGHVFTFGDASYYGGIDGEVAAGEAVTSISGTRSGGGYWLFTTKGRVVPFGDAQWLGDMAGTRLNGRVLDSIATPSGRGYYMVAEDGGIFTFGDADFRGSMGGTRLNAPVQSLVPDGDGTGYWLVASDGGIFAFDATFFGSMGSVRLNKPITGMVAFGTNGYLMVGEDGGIFTFGSAKFHGSLGASPPLRPITSVAVLA